MKKLEKLERDKRIIQSKIDDTKHKELMEVSLPFLRKAVGKCFKYRNSYGNSLPSWDLFLKITGVREKDMSFETIEFQHTSLNHIELRHNQRYNFDGKNSFDSFHGSDYKEIKPSEFNKAKKQFLKQVIKLIN